MGGNCRPPTGDGASRPSACCSAGWLDADRQDTLLIFLMFEGSRADAEQQDASQDGVHDARMEDSLAASLVRATRLPWARGGAGRGLAEERPVRPFPVDRCPALGPPGDPAFERGGRSSGGRTTTTACASTVTFWIATCWRTGMERVSAADNDGRYRQHPGELLPAQGQAEIRAHAG